jgi:hypothetical protein
MDVVQEHLIIHFMEGLPLGPSSVQAVEDFHGVEAVEDVLVAGEGFVDGSCKELVAWGPSMKLRGSVISKRSTESPLAFDQ